MAVVGLSGRLISNKVQTSVFSAVSKLLVILSHINNNSLSLLQYYRLQMFVSLVLLQECCTGYNSECICCYYFCSTWLVGR